jgi:FkbM family methyltransferase
MSYSANDNQGISFESKLDVIFKKKNGGVFIELGANDGLFQSNTAFLEFNRNWTGVLIEPSIYGYLKCKENRPNSLCLNYACVSNSYKDKYICGDFNTNHPMASVDGKRLNSNNICEVEATTLENILDTNNYETIDFLSLDAEGYELNILEGLNLKRYRPNYMLIEIYNTDYDKIVNFLEENQYKLYSNFSNYNKITNPNWDGTHNDYLFRDCTIDLLI